MNVRNIYDKTDSTELAAIEKRLNSAAAKLAGLVGAVGKARQIREWSGDQRKVALARAATAFHDESATKAESMARASFAYQEEMKSLAQQLQSAEETLASWDAVKCEFEAARSVLALHRQLSDM